MGLSLRDQLLQAGLIDEKQAKKATHHQGQQRRDHAKNPAVVNEQKAAAERAVQAKLARDAELNKQLQDKADQKARRAQVKQLVAQNKLPKVDSEELYNFIDGKKIRRIPVTPPMREQLARGELVIVRNDGRYEVVPAAVGDRIAERDGHALVSRGPAPAAAVAEDDPYKAFVVPDDLMW